MMLPLSPFAEPVKFALRWSTPLHLLLRGPNEDASRATGCLCEDDGAPRFESQANQLVTIISEESKDHL